MENLDIIRWCLIYYLATTAYAWYKFCKLENTPEDKLTEKDEEVFSQIYVLSGLRREDILKLMQPFVFLAAWLAVPIALIMKLVDFITGKKE